MENMGEMLEETSESDSAYVEIFADGNIQGLVQNSENAPDAIANGTLGISVTKKNIIWVASVNIASTTDTVSSGFGNIVLNPASGKSFTSGSLEVFRKNMFNLWDKSIGISGYASASSSKWSIGDTTKAASVVGLGLTLVNDIIQSTKGSNTVGLGFDVGLSYRGIYGDISNSESIYQKAIGSTGRHFIGLEGGLEIKFNKITAGLRGYALLNNKGDNVDGITSFQITGGITITGAFYQDKFEVQNTKKTKNLTNQ